MIHARAQLCRLLQNFFELQLCGDFSWGSAEILPAEAVVPVEGGRARFPFGKTREIVSIRFGEFDLVVESSHEAPPLGRITITGSSGRLIEQSLDSSAWERIGRFVINERIAFNV